jgi:hypothetical protein
MKKEKITADVRAIEAKDMDSVAAIKLMTRRNVLGAEKEVDAL